MKKILIAALGICTMSSGQLVDYVTGLKNQAYSNILQGSTRTSWANTLSSLPNNAHVLITQNYIKTITTGGVVSASNVTLECQTGATLTSGYNGTTLTITGSNFHMIGNCNFVGNEAANPTWSKSVILLNQAAYAFIDHPTITDQGNFAGTDNYGIRAICSHDFTLQHANLQGMGTSVGSDGPLSIQSDGCTGGASSNNTKIIDNFFMLPYNAGCYNSGNPICGDVVRIDADTCNGFTNDGGTFSGNTVIDGGARFGVEFWGSCGSRSSSFVPLKGWTVNNNHFRIIGHFDDGLLSLTTISGMSLGNNTFDLGGFFGGIGVIEIAGVQYSTLSGSTETNCPAPVANFIPSSITVDTSSNHNTVSNNVMQCGVLSIVIFNASNEVGVNDDKYISNTFAAPASGTVTNGSVVTISMDSCCTATRELFSHNHFLCQLTNGIVATVSIVRAGALLNHISFTENTATGCAYAYNNSGFSDPASGITNIVGLLNDWNLTVSQFVQSMGQSAWTDLTDIGFPEKHSQQITAVKYFNTQTVPQPSACTTGTGLDAGGVSCTSGLRGPGFINGTETAYSGTLTWTTVSPSTTSLFTLTMPAGAFANAPICSIFPVYNNSLQVMYEDLQNSTATSVVFKGSSNLSNGIVVSFGWDCKCDKTDGTCPLN